MIMQAYPQFAQQGRGGQYSQQDAEECWSQLMSTLQDRLKVDLSASPLHHLIMFPAPGQEQMPCIPSVGKWRRRFQPAAWGAKDGYAPEKAACSGRVQHVVLKPLALQALCFNLLSTSDQSPAKLSVKQSALDVISHCNLR